MQAIQPQYDGYYTEQEFFDLCESETDIRYEYADGEIIAMTGGSPRHARITHNIGGELYSQLKGSRCQGYSADLMVHVMSKKAYRVPDVTIICGELTYDSQRPNTVLNPTVVFEVVSPSSEKTDRDIKVREYIQIESLQHYFVVEQDQPYIMHYNKQHPNQWLMQYYADLEAIITLDEMGVQLRLSDIYDGVEFDELDESDTTE